MNRIPEVECRIYSNITSIQDIRTISSLDTQSRDLILRCVERIDMYEEQELPFSLVDRMTNLRELNTFVSVKTVQELSQILSKPHLTRAYIKVTQPHLDLVKIFSDNCNALKKFKFLFLLFDDGNIIFLKTGFTMIHLNDLDGSNAESTKELLSQIDMCLPIVELKTSPFAIMDVGMYRNLKHLREINIGYPFSHHFSNTRLLGQNLVLVIYLPRIFSIRFEINNEDMNFQTLRHISNLFSTSIALNGTRITKPNPKFMNVGIPILYVSDLVGLKRILPNLKGIQLLVDSDTLLSQFLEVLPTGLEHLTLFVSGKVPYDLVEEVRSRVKDMIVIKVPKDNLGSGRARTVFATY